ncbi:MAG: iron-regulated protein [Chitinophagaceae bacterium]|nr:MAG: iron-regulated protein [Chitinophagaceae bacterium]
MIKYLLLFYFIFCSVFISLGAESKKAFKWYDGQGNEQTYERMLEHIMRTEILLFGELHNNAIAHWFQYELLRDLHSKMGGKLVLGMEMFEADNQVILNEYLSGLISERNFESEARLWPNYKTDIKPLIEFAKENRVHVFASNIPRRYASMVAHNGMESLKKLDERSSRWIAPQPVKVDFELPSYKVLLESMSGNHHGMSGENFVNAQAIKDATMAHNIFQNFRELRAFIFHINGAYHSNNKEGIVWYLNNYNINARISTVSTVEGDPGTEWNSEWKDLADFILVVPASMTKTH